VVLINRILECLNILKYAGENWYIQHPYKISDSITTRRGARGDENSPSPVLRSFKNSATDEKIKSFSRRCVF